MKAHNLQGFQAFMIGLVLQNYGKRWNEITTLCQSIKKAIV